MIIGKRGVILRASERVMLDLHQQADGTGNKQAGRDLVETTVNINSADALEALLSRRPTFVAKVITSLAGKLEVSEEKHYADIDPYGIQDKIDFNHIVQYKEIFERYAEFGSIIDEVCDSLDVDTPGIKRKLFEYIKSQYLEQKGVLVKRGENLTEHADEIVTMIRDHMRDLAMKDPETGSLCVEDLDLSLTALITKAFIDCKLLEHPPAGIAKI